MAKRTLTWAPIFYSCLICSTYALGGQNAPPTSVKDHLRAYLSARSANGDFSGSVAVRRRDELIYEGSFGFADFENRVPFNEHSRFEVASITKTFTAAAIAILLHQGKLTLSSTLDIFIPDFPRAHAITIRHLLSHSSGVGELPAGQWTRQSHSLADVVKEIGKQPFLFEPGTSEHYSNSGFVLLASVIEKVSGKSYDEFLRENIFQPLGMTESGNFSSQEILPGRVHKYQPGPAPGLVWNVPVEVLSYTTGAGSASSTASDLLRWLSAVRLNRLYSWPANSYPYGWGRETDFGRAAIDQTGLHAGAAAAILTIPEDQLDVVCLSNLEAGSISSCAKDVAGIVLGESITAPVPRKAAAVSLDKLQCFQGNFRANERLAFNLRVDAGHLLFSWLDDPRDQYARPVGENGIFLTSQSADLSVGERDLSCRVMVINWKTPWDQLRFVRESKP